MPIPSLPPLPPNSRPSPDAKSQAGIRLHWALLGAAFPTLIGFSKFLPHDAGSEMLKKVLAVAFVLTLLGAFFASQLSRRAGWVSYSILAGFVVGFAIFLPLIAILHLYVDPPAPDRATPGNDSESAPHSKILPPDPAMGP